MLIFCVWLPILEGGGGGAEAPPRAEVQGRMSPDPLQKALGPAGPLLPIGEVQRQGLPPPHPTPSPPFL